MSINIHWELFVSKVMENENHLDNQINLIFETHLVNQVNGEIIILFHSLSKKCGNENHLDNQIKGEMPPRGVEKGVSQESPHFSFPEVTANDDGDDYGEHKEGSRSRISYFFVS